MRRVRAIVVRRMSGLDIMFRFREECAAALKFIAENPRVSSAGIIDRQRPSTAIDNAGDI